MKRKKTHTAISKINPNKKTYMFLGITIGVLSLAGFGYWYFKGRDGNGTDDNVFPNIASGEDKASATKPHVASVNSKFPLKLRSKGTLVKQVQEALIKKYGKSILPKYGVDSDFGTELEIALVAKGFSKIVDEATFHKLLALNETSTDDAIKPVEYTIKTKVDVTKNIWLSITIKKLDQLLQQLKRIQSVEQYKQINELFKKLIIKGRKQTIVGASLSVFDDATSKQLLTAEFTRMGLKYNGDQWTLEGRFNRRIITRQPTTIRSIVNAELDVPENTMLGIEVESMSGITTFRAINNELLTVPTKHINYV